MSLVFDRFSSVARLPTIRPHNTHITLIPRLCFRFTSLSTYLDNWFITLLFWAILNICIVILFVFYALDAH